MYMYMYMYISGSPRINEKRGGEDTQSVKFYLVVWCKYIHVHVHAYIHYSVVALRLI